MAAAGHARSRQVQRCPKPAAENNTHELAQTLGSLGQRDGTGSNSSCLGRAAGAWLCGEIRNRNVCRAGVRTPAVQINYLRRGPRVASLTLSVAQLAEHQTVE